MMKSAVQLARKAAEAYRRLSVREQRLANAVGLLLAAYLCLRIVRGALGQIDELDARIDRLQADIVNFSHQITRKQSVEEEYGKVAAQHSSEWTQAEIHDRLRQEIYRLAERQPPPLNEQGVPVTTTTNSGKLVEIPAIGQGILIEGEDGFREYRLSFRIPNAELRDMVDFLDRLQMSPQSLRIDGLDLLRDPMGKTVGATLNITRIVAAGVSSASASGATGEERALTAQDLNVTQWDCDQCATRVERAAEGAASPALSAHSAEGGGALYMARALPAGAVYELEMDLRARGDVWLQVQPEEGGDENATVVPVSSTGETYRYRCRYTVPGKAGLRTRLRVPLIELETAGSAVWLEHFAMDRVDE
jgi:hypothetical protein